MVQTVKILKRGATVTVREGGRAQTPTIAPSTPKTTSQGITTSQVAVKLGERLTPELKSKIERDMERSGWVQVGGTGGKWYPPESRVVVVRGQQAVKTYYIESEGKRVAISEGVYKKLQEAKVETVTEDKTEKLPTKEQIINTILPMPKAPTFFEDPSAFLREYSRRKGYEASQEPRGSWSRELGMMTSFGAGITAGYIQPFIHPIETGKGMISLIGGFVSDPFGTGYAVREEFEKGPTTFTGEIVGGAFAGKTISFGLSKIVSAVKGPTVSVETVSKGTVETVADVETGVVAKTSQSVKEFTVGKTEFSIKSRGVSKLTPELIEPEVVTGKGQAMFNIIRTVEGEQTFYKGTGTFLETYKQTPSGLVRGVAEYEFRIPDFKTDFLGRSKTLVIRAGEVTYSKVLSPTKAKLQDVTYIKGIREIKTKLVSGKAQPFIVETLKEGKVVEVVRGWSSGVLKEKFLAFKPVQLVEKGKTLLKESLFERNVFKNIELGLRGEGALSRLKSKLGFKPTEVGTKANIPKGPQNLEDLFRMEGFTRTEGFEWLKPPKDTSFRPQKVTQFTTDTGTVATSMSIDFSPALEKAFGGTAETSRKYLFIPLPPTSYGKVEGMGVPMSITERVPKGDTTLKSDITPRTGIGAEIIPISRPETIVSPRAGLRPETRPSIKPALQPIVEPSIKPALQPTIKPSVKPQLQPAIKPEIKPSLRPTIKPVITPHLTVPFMELGDTEITLPKGFSMIEPRPRKKKGRKELFAFEPEYFPSVEALVFDIRGKKPPKFQIETGLFVRPKLF